MFPSADCRALLILHLIPGLGPRLTKALLERFGSPEAVLEATASQLREIPYMGARSAEEISRLLKNIDIQPELDLIAEHGVELLVLGSAGYPEPLAQIADPPHLLYMRGTLTADDTRAVALVGSRHCTAYGRRIAERLATGLVRAGYTVVSGLARGIDGAAHQAALEAGGRTCAVLAGGLARVYPPEHAELAKRIEASGALLSEALMTQEPVAGLFPVRNRLISGLSQAVVVVEAAERSGTLITARHAAEQGRAVFAVPGPVDSTASAGTNALIREGAILARSVDDIVTELQGALPPGSPPAETAGEQAPTGPPPGLDELQLRIWNFLDGSPRHIDEMVQQLGIAVPQLSGVMLMLEMKRALRRLPGNRYERC